MAFPTGFESRRRRDEKGPLHRPSMYLYLRIFRFHQARVDSLKTLRFESAFVSRIF